MYECLTFAIGFSIWNGKNGMVCMKTAIGAMRWINESTHTTNQINIIKSTKHLVQYIWVVVSLLLWLFQTYILYGTDPVNGFFWIGHLLHHNLLFSLNIVEIVCSWLLNRMFLYFFSKVFLPLHRSLVEWHQIEFK